MELEDFLQRLQNFGCGENYFHIKSIGMIDKSCCPDATTEAIDFDKTKDRICSEAKVQPFKSCDALKILPDLKRLDFIEFKGFEKFIQHLRPDTHTGQQIDLQITKFDLKTKLHDSYIVLYLLLNKNPELKKQDKQLYQTINKNYLILVDIALEKQSILNLALTLAFLNETSTPIEKQIANKLRTEIENMSDLPFNISKPMLKSCKTIDSYYQ
jgi:hypothetical protein